MRNVKFISVFAACGFILSFVFGFFSHSSFVSILLKALIFGVIFVGLGLLISFVFNKFLVDSDSLDLSNEDGVELGSGGSNDSSNYVGQKVDVVVKEEELTPSDSDNHFIVGDNHQMLKSTDINEDSVNNDFEGDDASSSSNYVPLRNAENSNNFSGVESVPPGETPSDSSEDSSSMDENLDTLPDMENFVISSNNDSDGKEDESYSESGFASSTNTFKHSDAPAPEMKDAGLYAQAISTILSGDDAL